MPVSDQLPSGRSSGTLFGMLSPFRPRYWQESRSASIARYTWVEVAGFWSCWRRPPSGPSNLDEVGPRLRLGDRLVALSHSFEMQPYGRPYSPLDLGPSSARSHAPRQIGHICRIVVVGSLVYDGVLHDRSQSDPPACLRILRHVPGGSSSDGCPAIVTTPGRTGCLSWRWLPRVRTTTQPCSLSSSRASRTFGTGQGSAPTLIAALSSMANEIRSTRSCAAGPR